MLDDLIYKFNANPLPGSGRGKGLGYPTINVDLEKVPTDLEEGIYAGLASLNGQNIPSAIHYGPRPSFDDTISFEIHLIDHSPVVIPQTIEIKLIKRLRDIKTFDSEEALKKQIGMDIEETKKLVKS
ncbi:MAG: riboflavin kinase [Kiritimatiellales bacterium]|nr:riboflavin kinase [Kiritimatiellales bacterium]